MYVGYVLVAPCAYLAAGTIKFIINSVRAGRLAFEQIGLGGMPSTHMSVISAPAWLVAMRDGIGSPVVAVAVGIALVVALDAMDLRTKLGLVNRVLKKLLADGPEVAKLRDRMGHTPVEALTGVFVGGVVAAIIDGLSGHLIGF